MRSFVMRSQRDHDISKQFLADVNVKFGWINTFANRETFGATVMMSPVDGATVVNSFVMRSTISRDKVVPLVPPA